MDCRSAETVPHEGRRRSFEEDIDARRHWPSLSRAAAKVLPEEAVLLTPQPTQAVHKGLVRRVFVIGFVCKDESMLTYTEEYIDKIPDDAQLRYAWRSFESSLKAAQLV